VKKQFLISNGLGRWPIAIASLVLFGMTAWMGLEHLYHQPKEAKNSPYTEKVSCQLIGPEGQALGKQQVFVVTRSASGSGLWVNQTDADGRLVSNAPPGTNDFMFMVPGLGYSPPETIEVPRGIGEVYRTIRLRSGGAITGIARERSSGHPVGGVVIQPIMISSSAGLDRFWNGVYSMMHPIVVSGYPITAVSREGDGEFAIRGLPEGEYTIGYGQRCVVHEGRGVNNVQILAPSIPEPRSISGHVLQPGGTTPLTGTEVTLTVFVEEQNGPAMSWPSIEGVPRRVITDEYGAFKIYPIHPGHYWITASAPGFEPSPQATVHVKADSVEGIELVLGSMVQGGHSPWPLWPTGQTWFGAHKLSANPRSAQYNEQ
jgi:hypothetical protein